jgi:heme oxygenase
LTDRDANLTLRLRAVTAGAHSRLERDLNLLRPPLSRARFTTLLVRFWGFHAASEPAIRRHDALAHLMAGRYRLDILARDLQSAGLSSGEIEALPQCAAAGSLSRSLEGALGSLYVMEGSTLGGRLISRALSEASWLPPGGVGYFNPYGSRTAAMWRSFQDELTARSSPAADPLIEASALTTFAVLRDWLSP